MQRLKKIHAWAQMKVPIHYIKTLLGINKVLYDINYKVLSNIYSNS